MDVRTLVIWDWDGTLVDSMATILNALQDMATAFHLPPITNADVLSVMKEHRGTFWSNHFGSDFEEPFHYFLTRFEHHNATKELQLFEGALDAMRWLKSHNIPQMVISNKPQYLLDEECERLGLTPYFMRVIGTDSMDNDQKPNVSFGQNALQDLLYDSLVMIGDSWTDMQFASNIGAHGVYVQNPPDPNVPFDYHMPHEELLTFVQNYFCKG